MDRTGYLAEEERKALHLNDKEIDEWIKNNPIISFSDDREERQVGLQEGEDGS